MKCEGEIKHPFWHNLFTRRMGMWTEQGADTHTAKFISMNRIVRWCPFCHVEYHEGESMRAEIARQLHDPQLKPAELYKLKLTPPETEK